VLAMIWFVDEVILCICVIIHNKENAISDHRRRWIEKGGVSCIDI
jgi:hypothetical protein